MFNASITNLSASNASIYNASIYNGSIFNASITNLSARNASLYNASIYNGSVYNASITNLSASNANIYNVISPNIDASATQLSIGGTTASSLVLGKSANTTNILGNIQINSSSGTAGQVLTSNGDNTVPTWNSLSSVGFGWVGTASSNLSMGTYSIIGSSLDSSGTNLSIGGTTAESVTLGRATKVTNILGNFQINSSSGVSGQVLTSNGNNTEPTWNTITSGFIGTATSDLNMSSYNITNGQGLVLQSNTARAELYVQDGNDVVQIVPTQLAVKQGLQQIVLLPTGFVMNNTGGETTTRYNATGILTEVTSYGSIPFDITTIGGMTLQNTLSSIGQVFTADSSGNPIWQNPSFVGTATSNLSMGTNSIICSNIDASATALTIGGVTAQGLTIGKALTDTNILGNLKIAGNAGTLGQVLRSNATTAEWVDYGTATTNLAMGIYSITGTSLDSATTLTLGGTTATSVLIGRTNVSVNMSIVNTSVIYTPTITTATAIPLNIGTTNATPINIGRTNVSVNMSIVNTSVIYTPTITTATAIPLNIGTTNATPINIGRTGIAVNMSILNVSSIITPSIDTVASGTLSIGATNATTLNIGKSGATVNINTPIKPTYSYDVSGTGVVGSIGYMNTPLYTGGSATLVSGDTPIIFSQSISVNGVYLVCFTHVINCSIAGTMTRWVNYGNVKNNAGIVQGFPPNYATISLSGAFAVTNHYLSGSFVCTISGATAIAPWTILTLYEVAFTSGTYTRQSASSLYNFTITRIC
jgi:hypothetical protein